MGGCGSGILRWRCESPLVSGDMADTFHEVKSKRRKKKEVKDAPESRPRAVSSSSSHGSRTGVDCGGRTSSTQYSSYDYGISRGKPAIKKENETYGFPTSSILGPNMAGNNLTQKSTDPSESAFMENKTHPTGLDDGMPSSSQSSSGYQNNRAAKPGNVSMAYIVKMGKPQGKTSNTSFIPGDMPYTSHNGVVPSMSHQSVSRSTMKVLPAEADVEFHCSQGPVIEDAEVGHELGTTQGQHGDWSPVEESTIHETPYASTHHANLSMSSTLHDDEANLQLNPHVDEIHVLEGNIAGHNHHHSPLDLHLQQMNKFRLIVWKMISR